jgi:hypothetical protein
VPKNDPAYEKILNNSCIKKVLQEQKTHAKKNSRSVQAKTLNARRPLEKFAASMNAPWTVCSNNGQLLCSKCLKCDCVKTLIEFPKQLADYMHWVDLFILSYATVYTYLYSQCVQDHLKKEKFTKICIPNTVFSKISYNILKIKSNS